MGPTGCPERLVKNYHSTLRNIPEERRYYVTMFQKHRLHEKLTKHMLTSIILYCRVIFPQNNKLEIPPNRKWDELEVQNNKNAEIKKKRHITWPSHQGVVPCLLSATHANKYKIICDVMSQALTLLSKIKHSEM